MINSTNLPITGLDISNSEKLLLDRVDFKSRKAFFTKFLFQLRVLIQSKVVTVQNCAIYGKSKALIKSINKTLINALDLSFIFALCSSYMRHTVTVPNLSCLVEQLSVTGIMDCLVEQKPLLSAIGRIVDSVGRNPETVCQIVNVSTVKLHFISYPSFLFSFFLLQLLLSFL